MYINTIINFHRSYIYIQISFTQINKITLRYQNHLKQKNKQEDVMDSNKCLLYRAIDKKAAATLRWEQQKNKNCRKRKQIIA